ncbi:hypothetical protein QUB80_27705 [Chlorogloeopsis sp. ULAP01]|uniref:hypothetical protein n=1 Tax=Chlorogloeopsis sp. ULAP01 TaxID=3056483 RepID=UPI0025AA3C05|nr:hypothetical protein [Chlorogloeopsis sp. ULAP01]MDM9384456.1 hypothetical protein [Chlorogloeopsis sp. ULAP01]
MKSFTSLVLTTVFAAITSVTFAQSAKAQSIRPGAQYSGGYKDYRTYHPRNSYSSYPLNRLNDRCWRCFNRPANIFSTNGQNNRLNHGKGYSVYDNIRYRPPQHDRSY